MCPDYSHWPTSPALVWPWILGPVASLASINTPRWQEELFKHCGKQSGYLSSLPWLPQQMAILPTLSFKTGAWGHICTHVNFSPISSIGTLNVVCVLQTFAIFLIESKASAFSAFLRYEIRCPVLHSIHVFEFQEQC